MSASLRPARPTALFGGGRAATARPLARLAPATRSARSQRGGASETVRAARFETPLHGRRCLRWQVSLSAAPVPCERHFQSRASARRHRTVPGRSERRRRRARAASAKPSLHVHGSLAGTAWAAWALGPGRDCAFGVWPAGAEREKPAHARFETPIHDYASSVPAALSKPKPRAQVPHRRRADEPRAPAGGGEHEQRRRSRMHVHGSLAGTAWLPGRSRLAPAAQRGRRRGARAAPAKPAVRAREPGGCAVTAWPRPRVRRVRPRGAEREKLGARGSIRDADPRAALPSSAAKPARGIAPPVPCQRHSRSRGEARAGTSLVQGAERRARAAAGV